MPRAESFSQPKSNGTKVNYSNLSGSSSATAFSNSVDDSHSANTIEPTTGGSASKSVDEIMPLLNQTSINSSSQHNASIDEDASVADESDSNEGSMTMAKDRMHSSGRSKHGHGHRTKHQEPDAENGQSERGMMSLSRKKLKSKYMKSKAAKAGVVLDGANGQIITGANASDNEK